MRAMKVRGHTSVTSPNGDFSYDMLTTDEFNGEDILVDAVSDTAGQAERNLLLEKLRQAVASLAEDDQQLIRVLYVEGMTERQYAEKTGVYHNAIHYRKKRLLAKLKMQLTRRG